MMFQIRVRHHLEQTIVGFSDACFSKFVEDEWSNLEVHGRGSYVLKEKLKHLKRSLKIWNKDHFGMLDRNNADQVTLINFINEKGCVGTLTEHDISAWKIATANLWRLSRQKDNLLLQKSRQRWLRDGGSNTKFFHASINRSRRSKTVHGMLVNGEWVEDPIKNRPSLGVIDFKRISKEDNCFLTAKIEEAEINEVVWSCEGNKSPGPDGYNFTFIKKFWDCLKTDIFAMVDDFFCSGNLARGCNASFIVLIPKTSCPQGLGEYRPISLVGCVHKTISKILVGRLKKVICSVIPECQTVFIKGRNIMDGVVIANEIIDQARKIKGGDCFIFKVDFEKAYDSVNWSFLLYMMERMGFCFKWRN
ncbi:PREDICTED: uncharacterized protein LOC109339825 [Lupinus angustifolius]|uniref:uncharacterized protein LOC109339825 n=1 Tax=Lupinus angustifolius TaxID=3871 RepID=UPI00092E205E|nr:PREDICTED: uncharacterized protein LOC109339825 [Lupinus angustifolius]